MKRVYGWILGGVYASVLLTLTFPHILLVLLMSAFAHDDASMRRQRLGRLHYFWGMRTWDFLYTFLRPRVYIDMDPRDVSDGPFIMVVNHCSALDHVMVYLALSKTGTRDLRWVLKDAMRKVPVIGWLNALMGSAFLSRKRDPKDIAQLERTARFANEDRASIIIYPEGTRFRGVPKPDARFQYVGEPKSAGFKTLCTFAPTHRVLRVTIDWGQIRDVRGFFDVGQVGGACVYIQIRDAGRCMDHSVTDLLEVLWHEHETFLRSPFV